MLGRSELCARCGIGENAVVEEARQQMRQGAKRPQHSGHQAAHQSAVVIREGFQGRMGAMAVELFVVERPSFIPPAVRNVGDAVTRGETGDFCGGRKTLGQHIDFDTSVAVPAAAAGAGRARRRCVTNSAYAGRTVAFHSHCRCRALFRGRPQSVRPVPEDGAKGPRAFSSMSWERAWRPLTRTDGNGSVVGF